MLKFSIRVIIISLDHPKKIASMQFNIKRKSKFLENYLIFVNSKTILASKMSLYDPLEC